MNHSNTNSKIKTNNLNSNSKTLNKKIDAASTISSISSSNCYKNVSTNSNLSKSNVSKTISNTNSKSKKPAFELISSAYQQQFIRDLRLNFKPIKSNTTEAELNNNNYNNNPTNPSQLALLADKLGLSNSYTPENIYLNEQQWDEVKLKSLVRGDSKNNCSICYEDYKNNKQILLSCSHTFHSV